MKKGSTHTVESRLKISAEARKRERRKRGGAPAAERLSRSLARIAGRHGEEIAKD